MKLPPEADAPVLFRELSSSPRITRDLDYKIKGAEDVELAVRALSSHEFYTATDRAKSSAFRPAYIVTASLLADGEKAFSEPEDIFGLAQEEVSALFAAVAVALAKISPLYSLIDYPVWNSKLQEGALHSSNLSTALAMSECVDIVAGPSSTIVVPRPERYYGLPVSKLSDGQRMAFNAARKSIDDFRKTEEK